MGPITIQWQDSAQTIIHFHVVHSFTWVEFDDAITQMAEMAQGVSHRVDIIITRNNKLSPIDNPFQHLRRFIFGLPSNCKYIVSIGTPRLGMMFVNTLIRIIPGTPPIQMVDSPTLEEGVELIKQLQQKEEN